MKFKLMAAVATLFLGQCAMANAMPQTCPEVGKIQAIGVSIALQNPQTQGEWWGMTPNDTFDTNDGWTFVAGPINSQSQQGVLEAVNAKLSTLSNAIGPLQSDDGESYSCFYSSQSSDFIGLTITPAVALDSAMKFVKRARRK